MSSYVLGLHEVDRTMGRIVGGKGANLGELTRLPGLRVPAGFCVSTAAYRTVTMAASPLGERLDQLARLRGADRAASRALGGEIRRIIEATSLPEDLVVEITGWLSRLGDQQAYAVRSSATAEDLPTAAFAGQHDSYLNLVGIGAILDHLRKCWASLFTERAVSYRAQLGVDHRQVHMAVVVQQLIVPQVAGILFTADPVTSNRKVTCIDAGHGLGEALVSGQSQGDHFQVRDGQVIASQVRDQPMLTAAQLVQLEQLGRRIEAHFGQPQDIEWCLADGTFHIVQSRPITTLFPVPEVPDRAPHVYVSVGHQQMMTDAMKPLGRSLWQLTAMRPMVEAGGRLFVDVADLLAAPVSRAMLLDAMGQHDPLIQDALMTVIERGDLLGPPPEDPPSVLPGQRLPDSSAASFQAAIAYEPSLVPGLIESSQARIEDLRQDLQTRSGPALFEYIQELERDKARLLDPRSMAVIITAQQASRWLNEHGERWLGEKNVADVLVQAVPHNITATMGLELLEVADVIRPHPDVIAYLQTARDEGFLEGLSGLQGGREARDALRSYLDRYGMRGVGEIDLTRPRWSERPTTLVPLLLNHVRSLEPGASRRKFEQGLQAAQAKEQELLERLQQLPGGAELARQTKRVIEILRAFMGYREYPKYRIIQRYQLYKQALRREAEHLLHAGVLMDLQDIDYLTFEELSEVVRTRTLEDRLISQRKAEHARNEQLSPPRVMTSEGEVITGAYKREDIPAGALVGLPVSTGVIEGRARVLHALEAAELDHGDILVTRFTDPSWTPLFVSLGGLVTEVGGLMTHGSVIAREYGLPAVVGVEAATRWITDGQRIRVHGTEGFVELL